MANMKYTYQLADFQHEVKNSETGLYEITDNCKGFTDPDIEAGSTELSGYSGLMGTLEITDWGAISALEFSLKFAGFPDNCPLLINPDRQEHKISWADQYTDRDGNIGYINYIIYFTGVLKNIPGGDRAKGENSEVEFKYSVKTYKKTRMIIGVDTEPVVLFDYDPANEVIKFGERNFAEELKHAVLGE